MLHAATDTCGPGLAAPFARRALVPRAAREVRAKHACPLAIGSAAVPVQWTQLEFYVLANGRAPVPIFTSSANFTNSLNASNLGAVSIAYTNNTGATLLNVRIMAFADLDIDRPTNGFANEYGTRISLDPPPGAPVGVIAANAYEIDEPGFLFGDIRAHVVAGALDNFNAIPDSAPDDVSLAFQFPIGDMTDGQLASVQLQLATTNIGGLSQTDPASNTTVFFNGFAVRAALGSSGTPPTPPGPATPQIPAPSSLVLLGLGLGAAFTYRTTQR
ncbi:MAG: hypothetical protein IT162_23625 [Bryobacterales bacterium]|nr:hypothetical protein [Bryobacterales bacterium]